MLRQRAIELEFVRDAAVVAFLAVAVGEVDVGDDQFSKACDLHAALVIEARVAEAGLDFVGSPAREERDSAVTRPFRGDHMHLVVLSSAQVIGDLLRVRANLLESDHIALRGGQPLGKTLRLAGANAVDVPREDAHAAVLRARRAFFDGVQLPITNCRPFDSCALFGAAKPLSRPPPVPTLFSYKLGADRLIKK